MSNYMQEAKELEKVLKVCNKVLKLYNNYLPCDNTLDKYLIENFGYILPINENCYLEFSSFNPVVLGGNFWLCYDNVRIINFKSGATGIFHDLTCGLTLGLKKSAVSFSTKDPKITNKDFIIKLKKEIEESLPIIEITLKDNSFKISQLHDELKRKNIRVKQKELYNNPELLEKCRKNREFIGLDF